MLLTLYVVMENIIQIWKWVLVINWKGKLGLCSLIPILSCRKYPELMIPRLLGFLIRTIWLIRAPLTILKLIFIVLNSYFKLVSTTVKIMAWIWLISNSRISFSIISHLLDNLHLGLPWLLLLVSSVDMDLEVWLLWLLMEKQTKEYLAKEAYTVNK